MFQLRHLAALTRKPLHLIGNRNALWFGEGEEMSCYMWQSEEIQKKREKIPRETVYEHVKCVYACMYVQHLQNPIFIFLSSSFFK